MSAASRPAHQNQRGGDDSVQIQAAGDVHIGVSEERAREIAVASASEVLASYTEEANSLIQDRILKLDDRVIASLIREGRLEVFADPGFQRTYRRAQEGAATSERDADYDLLAALLVDRAERGSQRKVRAGIERSIEIIDRVDDEALRGLSVFQAVAQYRPTSPAVGDGLATMDKLLGQLIDGPLPVGGDWLDHLDVLDAVRVNTLGELRKFADFFPSQMPGYLSAGVARNDLPVRAESGLDFAEAIASGQSPDDLIRRGLWDALARDHELKPGFVRVWTAAPDVFEAHISQPALAPFKDKLLAEAHSRYRMGEVDETCRDNLMALVRAIPSLGEIEAWWNAIPGSVSVTAVGRVLARANADRLDEDRVLPPLK